MSVKRVPKMFFNPDVSIEEERYQSEEWKKTKRSSEIRSRKLISEEFYPASKGNKITRDMIDRAKEYPIENLIEVKNKVARCISGEHEDKKPSMSVKHNKVKCYSCGYREDSIGVAQKIFGLSWPDAVKKLQ